MASSSKTTNRAYVDLAQELRDRYDVLLQEVIQDDHMCFLAEQDVVSQVLDDLRYHHEPSTDGSIVRDGDVDGLRCHDSR